MRFEVKNRKRGAISTTVHAQAAGWNIFLHIDNKTCDVSYPVTVTPMGKGMDIELNSHGQVTVRTPSCMGDDMLDRIVRQMSTVPEIVGAVRELMEEEQDAARISLMGTAVHSEPVSCRHPGQTGITQKRGMNEVSLYDAVNLIGRIDRDEDVVYLKKHRDNDTLSSKNTPDEILTVRQLKEKYDLRGTSVVSITAYFCCEDYQGQLLVIKDKSKN